MGTKQAEDLTGRVVIVTGANSGLGKETAVALASMGATVVMTSRSEAKGEEARAEVVERSGSDRVVLGSLDLASFGSIRAFAAWFLEGYDRLDVLVNNAGLMVDTRQATDDGFELMFGVNHLGHFLLTDLLRERLIASAPARVVVVSSLAHRWAFTGQDRSDLQSYNGFNGFQTYGRSKLANAQFTLELADQLSGTGVTVNCLHPGSIYSGFGGDGDTGVMGWFIKVFGRIVLRSAKGGAKTQVMLASSSKSKVVQSNGAYWSHGIKGRASRHARNREEARWLWEESERLVTEVP